MLMKLWVGQTYLAVLYVYNNTKLKYSSVSLGVQFGVFLCPINHVLLLIIYLCVFVRKSWYTLNAALDTETVLQ